MTTAMEAAFKLAEDDALELHLEQLHQADLDQMAEFEANDPMSAEDIQAEKACEMMQPYLS